MTDSAGRIGRFEIVRTLGHGNCGPVHLARVIDSDREVALKVFDPARAHRLPPETAARVFLTEARAAAALAHPAIVAIEEVGEAEGIAYVAMECVANGRSLHRYCKSPEELLPLEEVVRIVKACADALHHAHECGVVHRDVKPRNILLGTGMQPKLTDFGLAVLTLGEGEGPAALATPLSPRYLAPEQVRGRQVSRHADIFSLGVVLYELLCGRHPFAAEGLEAERRRIVEDRHRPVRKVRSDTPRELQSITNRCLAKHPGRRYPSAMHLAADLEVVLDQIAASASAGARRRLHEQLRALECFTRFTDGELRELAHAASVCRFHPGDEVIAAGDTAACLYVIVDGEVGVRRDAFELAHLGSGEYIGEIGVLTGRPRSATVIALDRCTLLSIPRGFLERAPVALQLKLKNRLLELLAARLADTLESVL